MFKTGMILTLRKKIAPTLSIIALILVAIVLVSFDIRFSYDDYALRLVERSTGLGYGIDFEGAVSGKFEIWKYARTVHGGTAVMRIFPKIELNKKP